MAGHGKDIWQEGTGVGSNIGGGIDTWFGAFIVGEEHAGTSFFILDNYFWLSYLSSNDS